MSFVKNCTATPDLEEEILFNLSEMRYHDEKYVEALAEAHYHLERYLYHDSLIKELEVAHA